MHKAFPEEIYRMPYFVQFFTELVKNKLTCKFFESVVLFSCYDNFVVVYLRVFNDDVFTCFSITAHCCCIQMYIGSVLHCEIFI